MAEKRPIDRAWEKMFEVYELDKEIKRNGYVDVTAEQFHKLHFEPRKMTKIDHEILRPQIFRKSKYNILTLGFSKWRIGTFEVFQKLPAWKLPGKTVKDMELPGFIETIDPSNITGEQGAINAALASGILQDFLGQDQVLTVAGRMRSQDFEFYVDDHVHGTSLIQVSKAQIEIDGGFESIVLDQKVTNDAEPSLIEMEFGGRSAFTILEAKNHVSPDFLVRQLFYPLETWAKRLPGKSIRTVFMTLANDVYDLFEFSFTPGNYSSGRLIQHKRYSISLRRPLKSEVLELAEKARHKAPMSPPKDIPFPQANDFETVMDVVTFISHEPRTSQELSLEYPLVKRQSEQYYPDAGKYLGLIENVKNEAKETVRQATKLGRSLMNMPYKKRMLKYAELLLSIPPILDTYLAWQKTGRLATVAEITEVFKESPYAISAKGELLTGKTPKRRASTIRAWVKWLDAVAK